MLRKDIRKAKFMGTWYSNDPVELEMEIESWVGPPVDSFSEQAPLALIGPHAGFRFSGSVAGKAYGRIAPIPYKRIFLLGPSHYLPFEGLALPSSDLRGYATPFGVLTIARTVVEALRGKIGFDGPAEAHIPEHSLELHTPFLAHLFGTVPIIPLVVGRVGGDGSVRELARTLREVVGVDDLMVVSSDFTHYGEAFHYRPFSAEVPEGLKKLADSAIRPILDVDLAGFTGHIQETGDTICGREPIRILLASLPSSSRGSLSDFDTSGNMTGDFDHSVSYASLLFSHPEGWKS